MEEYKLNMSDMLKKVCFLLMKNSGYQQNGIIYVNKRMVMNVLYDEEECDRLLESMIIKKDNVIKYLARKYIPTWVENGAVFKGMRCIQKVFINKDGILTIYIDHSEPHKIYTDTVYVSYLMREHGFQFDNRIKFYINTIQLAHQDTLLYNMLLKEFGFPVPRPAVMLEKELKNKIRKLEDAAKIKKKSIRRKYLRYFVKRGSIVWTDLRKLINNNDFDEHHLKKICDEIREEAKIRGTSVDF